MMLSETIYVGGVPVGVARQDTTSKQITFSPTEIPSKVKAQLLLRFEFPDNRVNRVAKSGI